MRSFCFLVLWYICVTLLCFKQRKPFWRLRSKCLWFCCVENSSSRYFRIFGLKILGTISGILQEQTNLFQTQLLPFLQKSIDSWHWLHAPNTLLRNLDQEQAWLMLNSVRVTKIIWISESPFPTFPQLKLVFCSLVCH